MGIMRKKLLKKKTHNSSSHVYDWLPIDHHFLPPFTFAHVRGIAKVFLILEIALNTVIVLGTIFLTVLQFGL